MNDDIKFSLQRLKNNVDSGVLDSGYKRDIENIEEYINGLRFCIYNNKYKKKIDRINELLEELKYNQNINITKGLENRVDIDYIIERLSDCLGEKNDG